MIPPISVRSVRYVADSLRLRINDLDSALGHCSNIVIGSSSWTTDGPRLLLLDARLRDLVSDIRHIRSALYSVWSTLEPMEAARMDAARRAVPPPLGFVMSGTATVISDATSGRLWSSLRPLSDAVLAAIPHSQPKDDAVTVTAHEAGIAEPPTSLSDRVSRIPDGDTHIRIERFSPGSGDRFEVFLSGTNFGGGKTDPWNVGSNLDLAMTESSPSLIAVTQALRESGVTAETPLVITGHSQGGLLALAVARSHEFQVDAVLTIGTPVGVIPDVTDVPTIHIVHPEDPVPSLGGVIDRSSSTWIIPAEPGVMLIAAHHRSSYVPSAERLDELRSPEIERLLARIQPSEPGTAWEYRAVTTSGGRSP